MQNFGSSIDLVLRVALVWVGITFLDFVVVRAYSCTLADCDNWKLRSGDEMRRTLKAHDSCRTALDAAMPHPLKQSVHDVFERSRTTTNDDVDMRMALQK